MSIIIFIKGGPWKMLIVTLLRLGYVWTMMTSLRRNESNVMNGVVGAVAAAAGGGGVGGSAVANVRNGSGGNYTWPLKRVAIMEGDIILGGLMMVHEREDTNTCGPIMPQGGIQALETMLFTLDYVNELKDFLPGFRLGAHILDDCDKDTYGLEQAVDFIKGSIGNIDDGSYKCPDGSTPEIKKEAIAGVVGAPSSVTSIQVANLLRLFKIPQVSFFSTSPELSNKNRFEYFTRTIPADNYQVQAMIEIVKLLNWTYVSIIYEESNYGIKAFEVLEERLAAHNICIAIKERLVKDSGVAGEGVYDIIVQKLLQKPRARGVIIFGSDQEVAGVMRAIRRNNSTGRFTWIGSDGWSERSLVVEGNELEVEGTLSVQPMANPVVGFDEYFLNLTIKGNKRNPWFIEYWETFFKCKYPNSTVTPYNQNHPTICTGDEIVTAANGYTPESQLQFVSDSVLAFAHAFKNLHKDLCGDYIGLCDAMLPIDGTLVLNYLRNVNFTGLSGDEFRFDENGDGPARYNILHFKQTRNGTFKWIRVGQYYEGVLDLDLSLVQFSLRDPSIPVSVCSLPCKVGQAKKYVEGEICCWHCFNCSTYQVLESDVKCTECPLGTLPNKEHTLCIAIPEVYLKPGAGVSITAMVFSSFGIALTAFVTAVFFKFNDTPVVRASGRELSYVLLGGIFMCYGMTFVLVVRPSDVICGIRRVGIGFCFAVVYSALLTKTNRIARIFNAGKKTTRRPNYISPQSQIVICVVLIFVQIIITAVWLVFDPPKALYHHPTREDNHLVCAGSINASYMIAFSYPIILILVCTVYAILTRKIPEAFNESKYIGITMYTICIIWLAFVPIYFSTANNMAVRIITMCVSISLSATVALVCLFTPKLYIILLHPERNIRQSMLTQPQKSHSLMVKNSFSTGSSNVRVDSGTQSDEYEMYEKLKPASSVASSISRSTSATQTVSTEIFPAFSLNNTANLLMTNCSNSTQTMDSVDECAGNEMTTAQPEDVQL